MRSTPIPWPDFLRCLLLTAAAAGALVYAFILVLDPFDHLPFSPALARAPVDQNQRFSYPALARDPRFDSVVIGTSTVRLLAPARLDRALGGRFANLAMNSATAYEQSRMLELFVRHREQPRTVLLGIDAPWCELGEELVRYTPRPFPEWMYDDNPWNDLAHLFNGHALEQAARQLQQLLGKRKPRYERDGYENFLPPDAEYDLARARHHLYGQAEPKARPARATGSGPSSEERLAWRFPAHDLLPAMLRMAPAATRKVLVLPPYHAYHLPPAGSASEARWNECRSRIVAIAGQVPNTIVLDFMLDSAISREDSNYWDALHYTTGVADRIVDAIAQGLRTGRGVDDVFVVLGKADFDPVAGSGS